MITVQWQLHIIMVLQEPNKSVMLLNYILEYEIKAKKIGIKEEEAVEFNILLNDEFNIPLN